MVVALAVHGALFAGLLVGPRFAPVQPSPSAIEVELVRPASPPDRPRVRVPPARSPDQSAPSSAAAQISPPRGTIVGAGQTAPSRPPTEAGVPVPQEADDGLARALRTSVGCGSAAFLHLTPAERLACAQQRQGQRAAAGPAEAGLDPGRVALVDGRGDPTWRRPFTGFKPLKDCGPQVGTGPAGFSSDVAIGLNCTVPF